MPSYFKFVFNLIGPSNGFPCTVNAVMCVAVVPLNSSLSNATITLSLLPGTNLKLEKPNVGLYVGSTTVSIFRKFSSAEMSLLQPSDSS